MKPVVLIGLPGAGKSTVGRALARRLAVLFRDSDAEIEERSGLKVADYFRIHGEPAFRSLEREVIADLVVRPDLVIALGGGAFQDPATRSLALANALVVWLDLPQEILLERLGRSNKRPLFVGRDKAEVLRELAAARAAAFAEAHLRVPEATADAVLAAMAERSEGPQP
jgi:shikimate kinase